MDCPIEPTYLRYSLFRRRSQVYSTPSYPNNKVFIISYQTLLPMELVASKSLSHHLEFTATHSSLPLPELVVTSKAYN